MSDKVYVGNCATRTNKFDQQEVTVAFGPNDFEKLNAAKNEKGWVNLTLSTSREGKPYLTIWQKQASPYGQKAESTGQEPSAQVAESPAATDAEDDLPF